MTNIDFLNSGIRNSELRQQERQESGSLNENLPLGIKMPLQKGSESYESLFAMNKNLFAQVSNNYKTFLITKKGELLCKPDFGLTIYNIYNRTDLNFQEMEDIVMQEIKDSTAKYFPFIILKDFESKLVESNNTNQPNYVAIEIRYTLEGFEENINTISLSVRRSI